MGTTLDGLVENLEVQRWYLRDRTPAYATLLGYLKDELARGLGAALEKAWQGRSFFAFYDRPLLILGSLRYDALSEGPSHPLWSYIGEEAQPASDPTRAELCAALDASRDRFWDSVSRRTVQTNETTRAVAWLWPAHLLASLDPATRLHLVDVGTSAGLNLIADELATDWVDEQNRPIDVRPLPAIATRLGLDLSPLDVRNDDTARWLRACVWPSDRDRLERLDRAIAAFRARAQRGEAPLLETCPIEKIPARIAGLGTGDRLLVVQTIMRDYVPAEPWSKYERGLHELLASRPQGSALWVELEVQADGETLDRSAVLRAHAADAAQRVHTIVLARTQPHPRQLFVDADAVERLLGLLRRN